MPINTIRKKWLMLFFILFLNLYLSAKTMIIPFKVTPPENKNHQWLGRAISFFLTNGLQMNSIKIMPETKLYSMLHENNINFPYNITKASGIKLGLQNNTEFIIWGEIFTSADQVELKSFIINLNNYSQKYFPLLKFDIKNFYILQNELLKYILKFFNRVNEDIRYPQLNLDYHNYELLVKSFLIKETRKKITLLEKAYQNKSNSDFLNFELAKGYINMANYQKSNFFLEKISNQGLFQHKKNFLNALILYNTGYLNLAIEKFINLQRGGKFSWKTHSNLGAIFLKQKKYARAKNYLLFSLNTKKDPRIYLNYIKLLMDSGENEPLNEAINTALAYFPQNEKLKELFSFFLGNNSNKNILVEVFKKYLPDLDLIHELPEIPLQLINPFEMQSNNSNHYQNELNKIMKHYYAGDLNKTLENGEDLLEINPFIPELHQLISSIYLEQKQLVYAEMFAISSNYLKKSKKNYLILIDIYKLLKNKIKMNELRAELSKFFPE